MRRLARTIITLFVVVCASAPAVAVAQNGLGSIVRSVQLLDKNFDIADRNHDGKLSRQEAQNGHVSFIARNFDAIDTAHAGLVSKQQVHAYIVRMLMRSQPAPAMSAAGSPDSKR